MAICTKDTWHIFCGLDHDDEGHGGFFTCRFVVSLVFPKHFHPPMPQAEQL